MIINFIMVLIMALSDNGVVTSKSGLQYKIIANGKGVLAKKGNLVQVHYTGYNIGDGKNLFDSWLNDKSKDGLIFDSSAKSGRPYPVTLGAHRVIMGWEEGLDGMQVGEKRILVIPSSLAYGERGSGENIKPNATLKFEVELMSIEKEPDPKISKRSNSQGKLIKLGEKVKFHLKISETKPVEKVVQDTYSNNKPLSFNYGKDPLPPWLEFLMKDAKVGEKISAIVPAYAGAQRPEIKCEIEIVKSEIPKEIKPWLVKDADLKKTNSGLKYAILKVGTGKQVITKSKLKVHYSGFFTNGTKFDSSVENEEPLDFQVDVSSVIAGWHEGFKLLKVGSKARLVIPAALAYGEKDYGQIPGNSTLLFDVEVLSAD